MIVKKSFRGKRKKHHRRQWKIKVLEKEVEGSSRKEELQAEFVIITVCCLIVADEIWRASCRIWK